MNILRRFIPYIRPYWGHVALSLIATGLFVVFNGAAYWLSASFLAALFQGGLETGAGGDSLNALLKQVTVYLLVGETSRETLLRAAIAIVIAFLGKNLFSYLQLFFVSYVEQGVIKSLRDDLFRKLMRQDLAFFQRERRGDLISGVLNDVEQFNLALNKSFTKLIRDPINALVVLVLLFAVSWKLTLAAMVVIPIVGSVVQILGRKIKKHAARVQGRIAELTGRLQEMIAGIRVVKAFAAEPREVQRFESVTTQHFQSAFKQEKLRRLVIPLNEVVGVLIISVLLYIGGELVLVRGTLDSEDFIRFLVLLFALLTPLLSLGNVTANIRMAEASGERVFRLMDSVPTLPRPDKPVQVGEFSQGLRIDHISFRYTDDTPDVLQDIDLEIPRGQKLAIVGRSGSGKSTLLNLLPRFFDPTEGTILYDGIDLKDLDLDQLRSRFGIVTQDVILFHTTIAENIAYGLDHLPREEIQRAASAAHADEFIRNLPEGYDTVVGETGALFSGGQRQRISIARALLREPEIVLLDEATSALDAESETAVKAALDRLTGGRTVIIVTHRIAAVQDADRIVVLEQGMIAGAGLHDELINTCQPYRDLARKQGLVSV